MAVSRSLTLWNVPRRIAWRVMIPKKISTMFSQPPLVGLKCSCTRGGGWNAATLDGLPRSHVTMPARALTGNQVTDDLGLVAAKLADGRIDVPTVAYRDVRDAYAAVAGKADSRTGVLEPFLTAQLEHTRDANGLVIERE